MSSVCSNPAFSHYERRKAHDFVHCVLVGTDDRSLSVALFPKVVRQSRFEELSNDVPYWAEFISSAVDHCGEQSFGGGTRNFVQTKWHE